MPFCLVSVVLNESSHLDRFVSALDPCWDHTRSLNIFSLEPYLHQDIGSKGLFQFRFATDTDEGFRQVILPEVGCWGV